MGARRNPCRATSPICPGMARAAPIRSVSRAAAAAALALGILFAVPAFPEEPGTLVPASPEEQGPPAPSVVPGEPVPNDAELAALGATIGEIRIIPENIFDIADPREDNWLFRLANRLHIRTRPHVISHQLLFRTGDRYDRRLLDESERILRSNRYLYDAWIRPVAFRDGCVDIEVRTRDVWTLRPGISFERKGGKNTSSIDLQETNLLGLGSELSIARTFTAERTADSLEFSDAHLFGTWLSTGILLANTSDGSKRSYLLERPFYALDARWAAGVLFTEEDRIDSLVGVETIAPRFRATTKFFRISGGWSPGLRHGWAWRFLLGATRDESRFSAPPEGTAGAPVPANRVLAYPFAGFELLEDVFEEARNRDQIDRTEDFFLGMRLRATLGHASPRFGSDRRAWPFSASFGKGGRFGDRWTVTVNGSADGRVENGSARDTNLGATTRVYRRLSRRWLFFASLSGTRSIDPDDDHQLLLGGDNGLRGYPQSYQAGDRKLLVTVEQRYYTEWYPFRLFRVGGAIFLDAGRAWGGNATGVPDKGLLRDAGVGLRIGNARSGLGNVIHVDIAFPFDGDPSIDRVQLLVETKQSF